MSSSMFYAAMIYQNKASTSSSLTVSSLSVNHLRMKLCLDSPVFAPVSLTYNSLTCIIWVRREECLWQVCSDRSSTTILPSNFSIWTNSVVKVTENRTSVSSYSSPSKVLTSTLSMNLFLVGTLHGSRTPPHKRKGLETKNSSWK